MPTWTNLTVHYDALAVVFVVALASTGFVQSESPNAAGVPSEPFRVYLFADPRGEEDAVRFIHKAEKECRKILRRRKDWFELVERENAEIVFEIKAHWVDESMTSERSWYISVVREHHYLQGLVTMFGSDFGLRADDGRSRGRRGGSVEGAAGELVDALQGVLKKNYATIAGLREPLS